MKFVTFFCTDDDSEPILGPWFEEATSTEPEEKTATIPPPPPPPPTGNKNDENKGNERKDEDEMLEGPEKEETTMVTKMFQFLAKHNHCSRLEYDKFWINT